MQKTPSKSGQRAYAEVISKKSWSRNKLNGKHEDSQKATPESAILTKIFFKKFIKNKFLHKSICCYISIDAYFQGDFIGHKSIPEKNNLV